MRYWYWLSIFLHSVSISILQYISGTDTCYFFSISAKSLVGTIAPPGWNRLMVEIDWSARISYGAFCNTCCKDFWGEGVTKFERFLPKNQQTKRKLLNFENWTNGKVSKIEHHFSNKVIWKLMLSKNVKNYKCAPKLVWIQWKKKLRKIRMISDIENWL